MPSFTGVQPPAFPLFFPLLLVLFRPLVLLYATMFGTRPLWARLQLVGRVISSGEMNKTAKVEVNRLVQHARTKKVLYSLFVPGSLTLPLLHFLSWFPTILHTVHIGLHTCICKQTITIAISNISAPNGHQRQEVHHHARFRHSCPAHSCSAATFLRLLSCSPNSCRQEAQAFP